VSEVVALLRELVAIPSVSGDELACRDALLAWLAAHDIEARAHGRNVLAVIEGDAPPNAPRQAPSEAPSADGRGLLLCSHYDVVPVGPGWTRDPWDAALEAGRVHGRGANDAKSSVAAMVVAAARADRSRLAGRLVLAMVCDEETGGEGIEACASDLPPVSACVVGEPTGLDACPGQRGLLRASITVRGRSCHASRPWEGHNALEDAARDVLAIQGLRFPDEHPLLGRPTLQATVIAGGTRPNVIPGECTIQVDGRPTPGCDNEAMLALLQAAVGGEVTVKSERFRPVVTPPDAEIVRLAQAASPTGKVRGFQGVSDLFHLRHLPGVVMGPGTSAASHAPDEWVAVDQVEAAVKAYAALIDGYLGTAAPHKQQTAAR
jgi:acetylornithine deacetylase/succinyl-diaminopimelate desuccinylase-like protein